MKVKERVAGKQMNLPVVRYAVLCCLLLSVSVIAVMGISVSGDTVSQYVTLENGARPAAEAADLWDGSVAAAFAGGDGSEASPYLIETAAQLAFLAQQVNDGITTYEGAFLRLEADLDLDHQVWTPIGYSSQNLTYQHTDSYQSPRGAGTYRPFMGSFDGGGHTVSNLAVSGSGSTYAADYKGLFGIVDGGFAGSGNAAEIKNLTVAGASVTGSSGIAALIGYTVGDVTVRDCRVENAQVSNNRASANHSAGGLIGQLDLEKENTMAVQDCTVTDSAVESIANYGRVGGMIGSVRTHRSSADLEMNASAVISGCHVIGGSVTSEHYYVGGMFGEITSTYGGYVSFSVLDCSASAAVSTTGTNGYYVGGLIGRTDFQDRTNGSRLLIDGCHATGDVTASSYYVGGLIGFCENVSSSSYTQTDPQQTIVRNSYATGNVESGSTNAGGLIGHCHAGDYLPSDTMLVENCYATGTVYASSINAGGLIGRPSKNVTIRGCYATGDVYGGSSRSGGLLGYAEGNQTNGQTTVEACYSTGNVTGEGYYAGGFIGFSQATNIRDCYALGSVYCESTSVGGFLGRAAYASTIENCYSAGAVQTGSSSRTTVGGFVGGTATVSNLVFLNCFYDTTTSQMSNMFGTSASIGSASANNTGMSTQQIINLDAANNTNPVIPENPYAAVWNIRENFQGAADGLGTNATPWYMDDDITYPYLYYQYDGFNTDLDADGQLDGSSGDGFICGAPVTQDETNYFLAATYYSETPFSDWTALTQNRADFTFDSDMDVRFRPETAGAVKAWFPYAYTGTTLNDFDGYQYWFGNLPGEAGGSVTIPRGTDSFHMEADTPYSLGAMSATNIVAFDAGPYLEKSSSRPVWDYVDESTYTYVGDIVAYTIQTANYSSINDWKNVVVTDYLGRGVTYVEGTMQVTDSRTGAQLDCPLWDGTGQAPSTKPYYTYTYDDTRPSSDETETGVYLLTVYLPDFGCIEAGTVTGYTISFEALATKQSVSVFTSQTDYTGHIRNDAEAVGDLWNAYLGAEVLEGLQVAHSDENEDPVYDRYTVSYNDNLTMDNTPDASDTQIIKGYYLIDGTQSHTVLPLSELGFVKDQYEFIGWQDGDGTAYPVGTSFQVQDDVILYAQWRPVAVFAFVKVSAVNDTPLADASFQLYQYVGSGAPGADTLVDLDNPGPDWTAAGTATTGADGAVSFELPGAQDGDVFQLAETAAPGNFNLPTGQWRITVSRDVSEAVDYQITAINGSDGALPPAFKTLANGARALINIPFDSLPMMGGRGAARYGPVGAALVLAGVSWGILRYLQKRKETKTGKT